MSNVERVCAIICSFLTCWFLFSDHFSWWLRLSFVVSPCGPIRNVLNMNFTRVTCVMNNAQEYTLLVLERNGWIKCRMYCLRIFSCCLRCSSWSNEWNSYYSGAVNYIVWWSDLRNNRLRRFVLHCEALSLIIIPLFDIGFGNLCMSN